MTNKEYFHDIFKCLSYKQLGKAINLMHSYMADNPAAYSDQSLHSIEEDYTRMLNYMEQGFQDPDRDRIYQKLLQMPISDGCAAKYLSTVKRSNALCDICLIRNGY